MKISIIGGSGIVGHGIYLTLKKFHDVKIYDSKFFNNKTLKYNSNELFDCDLFIHAAGITDELVRDNLNFAVFKSNNFIEYLATNLIKSNCKHIVYISTIHVYGDLGQKINKMSKLNPSSLYSLMHYNSEMFFKILLKKSNINLLNLRIPTVYGFPKNRERINRPNIIQFNFPLSLIENNTIKLNSSGNQFRLFCSNYKVGKIILIWLNDLDKSQFSEESIDGVNVTVKEFAKLCVNRYNLFYNLSAKLILNDIKFVNEVYNKINVESKYKTSDEYKLTDFFDEFFNIK